MELDGDRCYEALRSRDRRFDGRFFTAVLTTKIYCRPVCPARTPLRKNVRFYAHAAAAEEAGFRPCRRCRPELAPGAPEWAHVPVVVGRALRLIDEGALDDGANVGALAARLHVGERQLRRLFAEHVGASPAGIARSRRAHFARRVLDETTLSFTDVAFASGFGSVRAFNDTMRAIFGRSPTQLRGKRAADGITVRVPFRPPLDWHGMFAWIGMRTTAGIEQIDGETYRRTTAAGIVSVRPAADALLVTLPTSRDLLGTIRRVRRMFDLDADPASIYEHLARDPLVRARPDTRIPGSWDPFETAVRVVLGQQISVRAATTLAGRLVEQFGKPLDAPDGPLTHLHPVPETLATADIRSIGATGTQQAAIRALATAVADGTLSFDAPLGLEDLLARLQALPGIGPWSANTIAMRCGEPDAFPASDLGLLKATGLTERALIERAQGWRPWRAYAALNLWRAS